MLKILHATPNLTIGAGGVSNAVVGLATSQTSLRHRVLIKCSGADAELRPGDGSFQVKASGTVGPQGLGFSPATERWALSSEAGEFDLLHQHGIWHLFSRMTARWRNTHRKPTMVGVHGSLEPWALQHSRWKKQLALLGFERQNLARATCLHVTSPEEVRGIRQFGLTNPVAVIPNGIAREWLCLRGDGGAFRKAHGIPGDKRLLLFLSRLHPGKGLLHLVEAFAAAGDAMKKWDVVVAGPVEDQDYVAQVRLRVTRLNLADRIHFVGAVHDTQKRDAFAAAEAFVSPTFHESFGIAIAESLGAGVPVLTTEGAIAWSDLAECRCGWRIPLTVPAFANALRHIAAMAPEDLAEMGARGVELVRSRYLWSQAAERSIQVYEWMLGDAPQPEFVLN